ncbi:MAG: hypothetical protein VW707_07960, partial [Candidatus Puniceispirillum sp.]
IPSCYRLCVFVRVFIDVNLGAIDIALQQGKGLTLSAVSINAYKNSPFTPKIRHCSLQLARR